MKILLAILALVALAVLFGLLAFGCLWLLGWTPNEEDDDL